MSRVMVIGFGVVLWASTAAAQTVRLEILSREAATGATVGTAGPYEILRGRIHGEVDPNHRQNGIIQDLELAPRNARGKAEYVATFALAKPIDMTKASGVLIYSVVNRGNGGVSADPDGHVWVVSGWQGDVIATPANQSIQVPIAKTAAGSSVTGPVLARFVNVQAGTNTQPIRLSSMGNNAGPIYAPDGLEQPNAVLTVATAETAAGVKTSQVTVPRHAWAFADCRSSAFPGTPSGTQICLKDGFDATKIYELTYRAKDPLVLGVGLAATRDIVAFFRHAATDEGGTANPVAGAIRHTIAIGDSQSGNLIKTFIHLGFNQDLAGRLVWDGVFPRIAARQTPLNFRFALPGGAATLYEPGSEPMLWWAKYEDKTRGRVLAGILDRCAATRTCPKVVEAFGSTEFWGLRMSPGLVGTDATRDMALPDNVRRYYYPGTTHGGGRGGFRVDPAGAGGGACALPANPNPQSDTTRALTAALVDWVVRGTPPPASRYPLLSKGELAPATRAAVGFPDVPGLPFADNLVNPVLDYDFGTGFIANDMSGVISLQPPRIRRVIPTYVPTVNADGNETSGVPSVLHQAPLGTYLGWNITAGGFYKGQGCGFSGGYWPFPKTSADRARTSDPRPSLQERYGNLEGYVCVVRRAAEQALQNRFLLRADADRLIAEVGLSQVLPSSAQSSAADRMIAAGLCRR